MRFEKGRTITEILVVLGIIGVLSLTGMWYYSRSTQEQKVNDILNAIHVQTVQIAPALSQHKFETPEQRAEFLKAYTIEASGYRIEFEPILDETSFSGEDFTARVYSSNGQPIKGSMCRRLIKALSEQEMAKDVDFTLKDEELEDGQKGDVQVKLNEQIIDLDALCGG
jgi:type II secretory pathway pseudopilin PulG